MAGKNHIFIASGDACPICEAMSGSVVEEGFRPHDNCNCNTAVDDHGDAECEYDYDIIDTFPSGPRTRAELFLTITCPNGGVHEIGLFATVDLQGLIDGEGAADELLEDLAGDQCEQLCLQDPPFLCC